MRTTASTKAHWHVSVLTGLVCWTALVGAQGLTISLLFDVDAGLPRYGNPIFWALSSIRLAIAATPVLAILVWPDRHHLAEAWQRQRLGHDLPRALAVNLGLFALVAAASLGLSRTAQHGPGLPWGLMAAYGLLLALHLLSLLAVLMPLGGLVRLIRDWRRPLLSSLAAAVAMLLLAEASLLLWPLMSQATLGLSSLILGLYETDVTVDAAAQSIRIGRFTVIVSEACSGYEGLALVTVFVTVQLALLRHRLRFPAALLLFPIGLGAIWLFNSVRIAALTSIGAHVSPQMAVMGFHSQAGWIAFLLVAVMLMGLPGWMGLLKPVPATQLHDSPAAHKANLPTTAYLAPFIALMLGSIAMSAAVPHERPVYILKALMVAVALWLWRRGLSEWWPRFAVEPLAVGALVGLAWIATDPAPDSGSALATWLAEIGPLAAAAWLLVRGIGTVILVPAAEEIAFRGYVYRRMIAADFTRVAPTHLSLAALVVSSIVFGLLHERWLAATLAGAVFAVVLIRSGRPGDAIVCHATANALIFAWALSFGQWSLL